MTFRVSLPEPWKSSLSFVTPPLLLASSARVLQYHSHNIGFSTRYTALTWDFFMPPSSHRCRTTSTSASGSSPPAVARLMSSWKRCVSPELPGLDAAPMKPRLLHTACHSSASSTRPGRDLLWQWPSAARASAAESPAVFRAPRASTSALCCSPCPSGRASFLRRCPSRHDQLSGMWPPRSFNFAFSASKAAFSARRAAIASLTTAPSAPGARASS
eukprot:CAMPEP_0182865994 /NCGR_PEP_ID=MMETSP0034_2-20130328/7981_1 /TAXON_ID=156128 /ORGANISM="Nephroselmis pyriformis, Strain CCMP717" /LENGTH=215 /DNA_ID=CAMNT_0024998317 /DNA_START=780 /DNA_END=1423 /DNA_ORIENTATION=+